MDFDATIFKITTATHVGMVQKISIWILVLYIRYQFQVTMQSYKIIKTPVIVSKQSHSHALSINPSLQFDVISSHQKSTPSKGFLPILQKKRINPIRAKYIDNLKTRQNKILAMNFILSTSQGKRGNKENIRRRVSENVSVASGKLAATPRLIRPPNNFSYQQMQQKIQQNAKYTLFGRTHQKNSAHCLMEL